MADDQMRGFLDGLTRDKHLAGWAWSPGSNERLSVEIRDNGQTVARLRAAQFRRDLLDAEIGDGRHGFEIDLRPDCFDGRFHDFTLLAFDGSGTGMVVAERRIAIPHHRNADLARTMSAKSLLRHILAPEFSVTGSDNGANLARRDADAVNTGDDTETMVSGSDAEAIVVAVTDLAARFGDDSALALLYLHLLDRPIDRDGLADWLGFLSDHPGDFATVVDKILASEEFERCRFGLVGLPSIRGLTSWSRLGCA